MNWRETGSGREGGQGSTEIRPKKDRRSEERGEELNEVPLELRTEAQMDEQQGPDTE